MPLTLSGDGTIEGLVDTFAWQERVNDPLTSLTGLTPGAGTWSVNTNVQVVAPANTHCRGIAQTALAAGNIHIVEAEVEIPAGLSNSSEHLTIGFVPSDTNAYMKGGIRGDGQAYFEKDALVGYPLGAYTIPAAGTWLKMRVKWDAQTDVFTLWLGGVYYGSYILDQQFTTVLKPFISVYDNGGATVRWRNFKCWSLTTNPATVYPPDPA